MAVADLVTVIANLDVAMDTPGGRYPAASLCMGREAGS
jgi:hypothetical protein